MAQQVDFRIFEEPIAGESYVGGGDPAQGLIHGDDSVWQFLKVSSGEQVGEIQGKIDPVAFAEIGASFGKWYGNALLGIENNQDGGANRKLFDLGYPHVYFEMRDRGRPYDEATPRLGLNMNARLRARLIAQSRRLLKDGSLSINSIRLVGQMEAFHLNGLKYEAIGGAHDDLVMAWLIASHLMWHQMEVEEMKATGLAPLVDGEELPGEETFVQKVVKRVQERNFRPTILSSVGDLV